MAAVNRCYLHTVVTTIQLKPSQLHAKCTNSHSHALCSVLWKASSGKCPGNLGKSSDAIKDLVNMCDVVKTHLVTQHVAVQNAVESSGSMHRLLQLFCGVQGDFNFPGRFSWLKYFKTSVRSADWQNRIRRQNSRHAAVQKLFYLQETFVTNARWAPHHCSIVKKDHW